LAASLALAASGSVSYTYDDMGRLVAERHGDVVTTYVYDAGGNLLRRVVDSSVADADMAIARSPSGPLRVGEPHTYTFYVTNSGPDAATSVIVSNALSSNMTIAHACAGQGACTIDGNSVVCDLGIVASGVVVHVMIDVVPNAPGNAENSTFLGWWVGGSPTNDTSTNTTTVAPVADLAITTLASPDPVSSNAYVTYTLTVDNLGPSDATGVVVTDTVPASVTIHSVTQSQGTCVTNGQVLTFSLDDIAANDSATATIVGRPTVVEMLTNAAGVAAVETDPAPSNNFDTAVGAVMAVDYWVTITDDNPTNPPPGSLRAAITDANAMGGDPVIALDLPGTSAPVIDLASAGNKALPVIQAAMTIDGLSHPAGRVEIAGGYMGGQDGLFQLKGDGITLRGVAVHLSGGKAVYIEGDNNVVEGCLIGTDATGTNAMPVYGGVVGIGIEGDYNRVGGTEPWQRNVIASCGGTGIDLSWDANSNTVQNCLVGTDITGTRAFGNGVGIELNWGAGNLVGGDTPGAANIISGNSSYGVRIDADGGPGDGRNLLIGNLIGTDITGTNALGNAADNIRLFSARNVLVHDNVIAAAGEYGIEMAGMEAAEITGNRIGTDVTGTLDLGNAHGGIDVWGAIGANFGIGGEGPGEGNVISGNDGPGISIRDGTNIWIHGNRIGLDAGGSNALANAGHGIIVGGAARHVRIGADSVPGRNVIAGNAGHGILVAAAYACTIGGNYVGALADGASAVGNRLCGIVLSNAWNCAIGGSLPPEANVVCGNGQHGIWIAGPNAVSNTVLNACVGTDATGTAGLGNALDGVRVHVASMTRIGGDGAFEGVTITHNGGNGVTVVSGNGNTVVATEIVSNGGLGIDLGNDGVTANDAGDGDGGANELQNFPVIENVMSGSAHIDGTLNSAPNRTYRLDFYISGAADPSGNGEGEVYLGSTNVTTDGGGDAAFSARFAMNIPAGCFAAVTATDTTTGDTSEFSPAFEYVTGDDDGDGIPNAWEQHYFNGPTNGVAGGDPDRDGFTTYQEYVSDTDPLDGTSYLRITSIAVDDEVSVNLWSSASRLYQLLYTDDLTDTDSWTGLPPFHAGHDSEMGLIDSPTRSNRSYRVKVRLP